MSDAKPVIRNADIESMRNAASILRHLSNLVGVSADADESARELGLLVQRMERQARKAAKGKMA